MQLRDAPTLLPLIQTWVLPATHIMSDGWAAYNDIDTLNGGAYSHDVIVHENNFVDPNDRDIHTQNVESMWSRAKKIFRDQYGTSRALFDLI